MTPRTFNNGYGGKFSNMIFLSVAAHLVVLTILMITIPSASRHLTFGPVYSVQLVSSEVAFSNTKASALMKEIEKSSESVSSIIYKQQIAGLAPTPAKKEEASRLNVEKAVSAIKRKQLDETPPSSSVRPSPSGSTATQQSSGVFTSWEREYSANTKQRVKRNFNIPAALAPRTDVEAIIAIRILRDGTLDYAKFEKHSGNRYFDDAAMKAVRKSVPFPAFPDKIRENSIEIGIIFHPSQLR